MGVTRLLKENGLKIQWAYITPTSNFIGPFSYPLQFTKTPCVLSQRTTTDYANRDIESNTYNVTTSSFYFDSNMGYPSKNPFYYIAIGY